MKNTKKKRYKFTKYITLPNGEKIYAWQYNKQAFRFEVEE